MIPKRTLPNFAWNTKQIRANQPTPIPLKSSKNHFRSNRSQSSTFKIRPVPEATFSNYPTKLLKIIKNVEHTKLQQRDIRASYISLITARDLDNRSFRWEIPKSKIWSKVPFRKTWEGAHIHQIHRASATNFTKNETPLQVFLKKPVHFPGLPIILRNTLEHLMSASENIRTIKIYALYLLLFLGYLFSQGSTILIICTHVAYIHFSVPCFDEIFKHFKRFCRLILTGKKS